MLTHLQSALELWAGLLTWVSGKEPACYIWDSRDAASLSGLEKAPGGENGNPFQYCCLENSMDKGDWWGTVHGVAKKSDTTENACTPYKAETYKIFKGKTTFQDVREKVLRMKCRHCWLEICQGTPAMIREMGGVPTASDTTKPCIFTISFDPWASLIPQW